MITGMNVFESLALKGFGWQTIGDGGGQWSPRSMDGLVLNYLSSQSFAYALKGEQTLSVEQTPNSG